MINKSSWYLLISKIEGSQIECSIFKWKFLTYFIIFGVENMNFSQILLLSQSYSSSDLSISQIINASLQLKYCICKIFKSPNFSSWFYKDKFRRVVNFPFLFIRTFISDGFLQYYNFFDFRRCEVKLLILKIWKSIFSSFQNLLLFQSWNIFEKSMISRWLF